MNSFPQRIPLHIEAAQIKQKSRSLMTPLVATILLATGGVTDAAATIATGHGILAETGLPMEAQLGLSLIFLAGFCYAAKLVLAYHRERVDELKEEKRELIKRIRELQDARDKRLDALEGDDGR